MFIRPSSIPHPSVWLTFQGKDLDGSSTTTYEIRDLIDEDLDEALDLMQMYYLRDEPISKVVCLLEDPQSIDDNLNTWRKCMKQKMPIACYETKTGKLVGVNFLWVSLKSDPMFEVPKGERSKWAFKLYAKYLKEFNAFETLNTDIVLIEFGLGVHEDYRKRGIATELLNARIPMMRAMKIDHALTIFSAVGSQKAGVNAGYHDVVVYR